MTLPASIRVNVRVPFPALVQGASFITVAKANGIWTLAPNYQLLAQAVSIKITQLVAVYDTSSGVWNYVTASSLASGGGTLASMADVQITEGVGINGDVLTYNNSVGKWVASPPVTSTPTVTTVANLSTVIPSPTVGQNAYVTDAVSGVFGAGVAGGGSVGCPVHWNGTAWIAG